ncbi:MAG: hypothetical protein ABI625_10700 [bacterium]
MSSSDPRSGAHYQVDGITFFAMIGSQRSGTNFVREMLNTNPAAVVHGEVLLPYPVPITWHNFLRNMVSRALPPITSDDAMALLDEYLIFAREDVKRGYAGKAKLLKAVGFDIKYNQLRFIAPVLWELLDPPFFVEYLRRRHIPILHVVRRNVLHQALSLHIAELRNVYHNYGNYTFSGSLELSPVELLRQAEWISAGSAAFRSMTAGMNILEVFYEDVATECETADSAGKLRVESMLTFELARFLGIGNDFSRPQSINKVINRPYAEIISNHEQVVAAVRDSQFAEFADSI